MGVLTVAVPCYIVARTDGGDVNHRAPQLEMGMERIVQLEAQARICAVQRRVLVLLQPPVIRREEVLLAHTLRATHRLEEWAKQVIRCGPVKQRVDPQCAFPGRRGRHAHPALEHAEHAAGSRATIVIAHGIQTPRRLPWIESRQVAAEDSVIDAAEPVAVVLPALDAAAVAMRAKREAVIARVADA